MTTTTNGYGKWTTVRTQGYTPVTDDDGRAAGGTVDVQIRKRGGIWFQRHVASNAGTSAIGQTIEISESEAAMLAPINR